MLALVGNDATERAVTLGTFLEASPAVAIKSFDDAAALMQDLEASGASQPRLILLDVAGSVFAGLADLRTIRTDPRAALLPVVLMYRTTDPAHMESCYRLGANSLVRKPDGREGMVDLARVLLRYWQQMNEPLRR